MLMPLLVRLTDPQIEMADGGVSQVPDAVKDGSRILEQVRAAGLSIHEEALLPDLDVKPLHPPSRRRSLPSGRAQRGPGGRLQQAVRGRSRGPSAHGLTRGGQRAAAIYS